MSELQEITIAADHEGARLDKWVQKQVGIPYGLVQKLVRKGAIRVDGMKVKPEVKLMEGQVVRIPELEEAGVKRAKPIYGDKEYAEYIEPNIIFENTHFIAINKPRGLACQGGSGVRIAVDQIIAFKGYKLAHRIDKDTSGILLIGKSDQATKAAAAAFKSRDFVKRYWAVTVGVPNPIEGSIIAEIAPMAGAKGVEKMMVAEEAEKEGIMMSDRPKKAVTHYKVLENAGKRAALVELEPETGRKHQIRVHLDVIECPILGDGKYGGKEAFITGLSNEMQLHARHLHHDNLMGATLSITADIPDHIQKTFDYFEWDVRDYSMDQA